jgi:hypothetical protein
MGSEISVPVGTYVFAYNNSGQNKIYGETLSGDNLKPCNVPGSYPSNSTFKSDEQFACRGQGSYKTTTLWVRIP